MMRVSWCAGPVLLLAVACSAAGGSNGDGLENIGPVANTGGGSNSGGSGGQAPVGPSTPTPVGVDGDASAVCGQSAAGLPALRRLNRREIESTLRAVFPSLGASWRSVLSADTVSASGFDNDAAMLQVSKQTARELAETAESVATVVAGGLNTVLPCASTAPDAGCAGQYLDGVGRRLFRRPLSADERATYLDFFNTALTATSDFGQSIAWLTRGLIESPSFVYRREIGALDSGVKRLDQYEIATELAYTFSGAGPSDELLDRAERGEFSSPQELVATARELLLTPAGREVIQTFFDAYVGHSRVTAIAKVNVPEFPDLREQMLEETRHFIDEVIVNRNGGIKELLTANFTTPTLELAQFYGFPAPASDFAVVERPPGRGIGLLAQGAVLATLAQPNGSSPTKRGMWIYKRLLCNVVPDVPPNIPELKPPQPGARTTRQRYEEDHAQGSCQGCHSRWDPIGFGFEHFDEAGRYREEEGGLAIDTQSHVDQRGQTLFEFNGEEDLMTQLADEPLVYQCLSGYLNTFAFGEELTCSGETRRAEFMSGSLGLVDYLASLAGEPHFSQRRLE
jgi:hypothetical protein